jgi:hypothetical protein
VAKKKEKVHVDSTEDFKNIYYFYTNLKVRQKKDSKLNTHHTTASPQTRK